jgi:hypothetical protein
MQNDVEPDGDRYCHKNRDNRSRHVLLPRDAFHFRVGKSCGPALQGEHKAVRLRFADQALETAMVSRLDSYEAMVIERIGGSGLDLLCVFGIRGGLCSQLRRHQREDQGSADECSHGVSLTVKK